MSKKFIIDNCFYCNSTFPDELDPEIIEFFKKVDKEPDCILFIPYMFLYESMNSLEIAGRRKRFKPGIEEGLFSILKEFVKKVEKSPIVDSNNLRKLSKKYLLTMYDASYLELAIEYDAILCTTDFDLKKAAKKEGVKVWRPTLIF